MNFSPQNKKAGYYLDQSIFIITQKDWYVQRITLTAKSKRSHPTMSSG